MKCSYEEQYKSILKQVIKGKNARNNPFTFILFANAGAAEVNFKSFTDKEHYSADKLQ